MNNTCLAVAFLARYFRARPASRRTGRPAARRAPPMAQGSAAPERYRGGGHSNWRGAQSASDGNGLGSAYKIPGGERQ